MSVRHRAGVILRAIGLIEPARRVQRLLDAPRHRRLVRARQRFYSAFVGEGDLCFDVGANLGNRTSVFLSLGARVVAVEPHPVCVDHLRRAFGNTSRVTVVDRAVGAEEGMAELHVPKVAHPVASMNSQWIETMEKAERFPGVSWEKTVQVPVTTLDRLIEEHGRPRFCKVDVEGFEEEVFKGLSEPVACVSYEYNEEFLQPAIEATRRLATLGHAWFNVSIGESMRMHWTEWGTCDKMVEFLSNLDGGNEQRFGDVYASVERPF